VTSGPETEAAGTASFGPAQTNDLEALVSIDRLSPSPWGEDAFRAELERSEATLFVLRSSGQVLAFAATRIQIPEMDILNLAVAPRRRQSGFGRLLVRLLLEHAALAGIRRVFLEVREGNHLARKLYENSGFRETQRRRGFYREPEEDAILMSLKIEP
jgi:ribosomal-protein-alanine N-acetyltransferase